MKVNLQTFNLCTNRTDTVNIICHVVQLFVQVVLTCWTIAEWPFEDRTDLKSLYLKLQVLHHSCSHMVTGHLATAWHLWQVATSYGHMITFCDFFCHFLAKTTTTNAHWIKCVRTYDLSHLTTIIKMVIKFLKSTNHASTNDTTIFDQNSSLAVSWGKPVSSKCSIPL